MTNNKEVWKDIQGFEGLYEISNYGNVRSLKFGKIKLLKPAKNKFGYYHVILCKNGQKKEYRVHRLVANAFIPNPLNYPQINHKDENKLNNKVENLEWCNNQYNKRYSCAKKVVGINPKDDFIIVMGATVDGEEMGFNHSAISAAASGKFYKKGNHTYKGLNWYYIPNELYNVLVHKSQKDENIFHQFNLYDYLQKIKNNIEYR